MFRRIDGHTCDKPPCLSYATYIRKDRKRWIRVGTFFTGCKSFSPKKDIDLEYNSNRDTDVVQTEFRKFFESIS